MKKLLTILIGILLMSNISFAQTDSLLNEYNKRLNRIELNLNNFIEQREVSRMAIFAGIGMSLLGTALLNPFPDQGKLFIYGGMGISLIGTVSFHLADRKLKFKK